MARYQFNNPAAEASGGVRAILTQQREDARKRMLDEMAIKNAESQRAVEAQQIAASQQQVEASKAGLESTKLAEILKGRTIGEDLSTLDPEARRIVQSRGLEKPAKLEETPVDPVPFQSPQVGDEGGLEGPMAELGQAVQPRYSPSGFVGSPDERDRERKVELANKVMKALKDNPDMPITERVGLLAELEAAGVNLDSGTYSAATRVPQESWTFDQDTGVWSRSKDPQGNLVPDNAKVTSHTRPPRPLQTPAPNIFIGGDGKPYQLQRGASQMEPIGTPEGVTGPFTRPGSSTAGASSKAPPDLVPAAAVKQLGDFRGRADREPAFVPRFFELATNIIAAAKTLDPSINSTAQMVLEGENPIEGGEPWPEDPNLHPSAEELGMTLLEAGEDPKEVRQLIQLIKLTRGS